MSFKHPVFSGIGVAGLIVLLSGIACLYLAVFDKNWAAGLLAVVLVGFGTDALYFETIYAWTNGGLGERYKLWKKRRFWNIHKQHEHLRTMVQMDSRWLAHLKVADELTKRYLDALDVDWYSKEFESTPHFRQRLKLEPNYKSSRSILIIHRIDPDSDNPRNSIHSIHFLPAEMDKESVEFLAQSHFKTVRDVAIAKNPKYCFGEWTYEIITQSSSITDAVYIQQ